MGKKNKEKSGNKTIEPTELTEAMPTSLANLTEMMDMFEGDEEEAEEEEMSYHSIAEPIFIPKEGRIDLSFPETDAQFAESVECYPESYYTLSPKERLFLLYAENFRKQFIYTYPTRRPLVLAVKNECDVQKFVCTTVRPTGCILSDLIGNQKAIASFVADFIAYETLDDIISLPPRLVSPTTLLRQRKGNSFEMATLLCSLLIGARFPALVVSGVAKSETILNDQRNVEYPGKIRELYVETDEQKDDEGGYGDEYKLKPEPELRSHLDEILDAYKARRAEEDKKIRDEIERLELEAWEIKHRDKHFFRRSHAWVVIIDNAPWSLKPRKTFLNEQGETVDEPPKARFIEPTTGFECDTSSAQYILVDSIWNDSNYFVNLQTYEKVSEIRWDLRDNQDWEHFLPGEPPELRVLKDTSFENIAENEKNGGEEKHLDTLRSWVGKIDIDRSEFEQRFPERYKIINYRRLVHERFSMYYRKDGLIEAVTRFSDDDYKEPEIRWAWYANRADLLERIKFDFNTSEVQETFLLGRSDNLLEYKHNLDWQQPKFLTFNPVPRLDSLKLLEVFPDRIVFHYSNRTDMCYFQEFISKKPKQHKLHEITEKFHRNTRENLPPYNDIAIRQFFFYRDTIYLQFQYAPGALTASSREFIKPPKPNYGCEIIFDPSSTRGYKANPDDPDPTQLELYLLLLEQLKYEEKLNKIFQKHIEEIDALLEMRREELVNVDLKFCMFDPLRNSTAKKNRLDKIAKEEERKRNVFLNKPDFLAPYLVSYTLKDGPLTKEESKAVYDACLNDMKTRSVNLLNDLQKEYETLVAEGETLNSCLMKFENQFDDFDYKRLKKEAEGIELRQRMVQQRLLMTHEQSQKKYDSVKDSLTKDKRLTF